MAGAGRGPPSRLVAPLARSALLLPAVAVRCCAFFRLPRLALLGGGRPSVGRRLVAALSWRRARWLLTRRPRPHGLHALSRVAAPLLEVLLALTVPVPVPVLVVLLLRLEELLREICLSGALGSRWLAAALASARHPLNTRR
jgi:hypothetical protein